uniref:Protein kinase domain-containing protein n=1 Tax=Haemonchus contortus TaxID=6289 RepID=A0A7I4Z8V0_HAECO
MMESGEPQVSNDFKNRPHGDTPENNEGLSIGPTPSAKEKKHELNGQELPYDVINGMPMFQKNHVIGKRYQIFERIGWDDRVGATYLVTAPDGKELVLRVGNDQILIPQLEASFLCKIEQQNLWRFFSQVHSIYQEEKFYYLALYFRSGPALSQCLKYCGGKFTHGSGGRLALDVLRIIRITHNLGYLVRSLNLEMFHFDACSRQLFMADLSTVRKDTSKSNTHNHELVMPHWCGSLIFAPMTFHDDDPISCRDELEAWIYFFVYLVKGTLPWENDRADDVKWTKIKSINYGELFEGLPKQYKKILDTITREGSTDPVSNSEYDRLEELTKEIIYNVGNIRDEDDNFDFERDPTEDEIPRFVVERNPNIFGMWADEACTQSSYSEEESTTISNED